MSELLGSQQLADSLGRIPESIAVERLAVILAAAVGQYWFGLSDESKTSYRVMANQALFLLGAEAHVRGLVHVRQALEDMASTMRRAADKLEEAKGDEMTIRRLHVGASNCDAILMVLDAAPDDIGIPISEETEAV